MVAKEVLEPKLISRARLFFNYFCTMLRYFLSFLTLLVSYSTLSAQDSLWTLERSIHYALEQNIDIRQNVLNERLAALQLTQNKWSQLPTVSLSGNIGRSFGRSIDPTSNQFIDAGYNFVGLSGNADVLLFGWFQKRNSISGDKLAWQAAKADYEQLQDDVSLNVATAFLRILLAKEQITVAEGQLQVSNKQLVQTQDFVRSGRAPELDLAQMQAQVANDSANYFTAMGTYYQSLLDMKALMNLDMADPFYPVAPKVDEVSVVELAVHTPEEIYASARTHFGNIKSGELQKQAAEKRLSARKGALYPQLGLGAQMGSNYASTLKEVTDVQVTGTAPTGDFIQVNNNVYPVMAPTMDFNTRITPLGNQVKNNFRQTIALSLTVPLFNGLTARTAVNQAKIDIQNQQLNLERTEQKLKQDVYLSYSDARMAFQKHYAAQNANKAAQRAADYAAKRYELGLMSAVELLNIQNNGLKAKTDELTAKYDLVFKLKIIDYYLGKELKL